MNKHETALALILFKEIKNNQKWWDENTRRKATGEVFVSGEFVYTFADLFHIHHEDVNPYYIDAALELLEPKIIKPVQPTGEAHVNLNPRPNK